MDDESLGDGMRFTPENITRLEPNEVFVFGSNLQGIHGAGAAKTAMRLFGAKRRVGVGMTGQCYAIPTRAFMAGGVLRTLPLDTIRSHVDAFMSFAGSNPYTVFLVTPIGTGHAGYLPEEIAPLFQDRLPNVIIPKRFHEIISNQK